MFQAVKNLYLWHVIDINGVSDAVAKGIITREEYQTITGESYQI